MYNKKGQPPLHSLHGLHSAWPLSAQSFKPLLSSPRRRQVLAEASGQRIFYIDSLKAKENPVIPRIRPKICQKLAFVFKISRLKPLQSRTKQDIAVKLWSQSKPRSCKYRIRSIMDRSYVGGLHT